MANTHEEPPEARRYDLRDTRTEHITDDSRFRQEHERTIAILEYYRAQAEEVAVQAPAVAHRALSLCERCAGIPELSINRCPVCRCLWELIS